MSESQDVPQPSNSTASQPIEACTGSLPAAESASPVASAPAACSASAQLPSETIIGPAAAPVASCAASSCSSEAAAPLAAQPVAHPAAESASALIVGHVHVECSASIETVAPAGTEAAVAPEPVATATAVANAPLTDATANDLANALTSSKHARSSAASKSVESDLVARRIVLRRDRWDALLSLTNALAQQRGIVATPAEVAAIVLDAGLNVILEEANESRPAAASAVAAAPAPAADVAPAGVAEPRVPAKPKAKAKAATGRRPKAKAKAKAAAKGKAQAIVKAGKTKASRRSAAARARARRAALPARPKNGAPAVRAFTAPELAGIRALVKKLKSDRAIQRTLALWLGAHTVAGSSVAIPIEDLRSLCREFKVYDTANFAQNMKKDLAFFVEVRDRQGERLGYQLTAKGQTAAAGILAEPIKA